MYSYVNIVGSYFTFGTLVLFMPLSHGYSLWRVYTWADILCAILYYIARLPTCLLISWQCISTAGIWP